MARKKKEETTEVVEKTNKPSLMNKDILKFEDELSKIIEKQTGAAVTSLSERDFVPYWHDTGNYALNWICSHDFYKGLPGTKAILIEGENSKGKSLLLAKFLGMNIVDGGVSWYIDTEDASNFNFIKQIVGDEEIANRIKRVDEVPTIERLNKVMTSIVDYQIAKGAEKRFMVGIDSYSQLSSEKEMKTAEIKYNPNKEDARDMTKSQKSREGLRAIVSKFNQAKMTPIYIAHITQKIGVMFGDPTTPATHGSMLLYAVSLRLGITSSKDIKDNKYPIPIGVRLTIQTKKNRSVHKGKRCTIDLYFKTGIDRFSGLVELLGNFKIVKVAANPEPTSKVEYDGIEFKTKDLESVVQEYKEKGRDLLAEWQEKLAQIVEFRERDLPEEDYLTSDDGIETVLEDSEEE